MNVNVFPKFILKAFAQLFLTIINRHLVNNTIQLKHGVRIPVLHFALTDTHMLGYRFIWVPIVIEFGVISQKFRWLPSPIVSCSHDGGSVDLAFIHNGKSFVFFYLIEHGWHPVPQHRYVTPHWTGNVTAFIHLFHRPGDEFSNKLGLPNPEPDAQNTDQHTVNDTIAITFVLQCSTR